MGVKYNTEWFIEKAKKVHGDLYDYSLVNYKNSQEKIDIVCSIHGVFQQRPNDHTSHKNGCPLCGSKKQLESVKLTKDAILDKFYKVHGDKYDYSSFDYTGTYVKSIIKCKKHGYFKMNATSHLTGMGCKQCTKEALSYNRNGLNVVYVTEGVFLERALDKHGSKYDYSNMEYVDFNTEIEIKCNKHNELIKQIPKNHLSSKGGCLSCKKEAVIKSKTYTTEEFIEASKKIHKNTYSYDYSVYIGNKKQVIITCPTHGNFRQRPNDHLTGHGCVKCGNTGGVYNIKKAKRNKEEWSKIGATVYLIDLVSETEDFIKIGISKNKEKRYSDLSFSSGCCIIRKVEFNTDLYSAVMIEQSVLKKRVHERYTPNISFHGYTECLNKSSREGVLTEIINYLENKQ